MNDIVSEVDGYRFQPADLDIASRRPGISAFMRIRDGAFSLEAAIRSHIPHFDEIVAVYNRCTDATPQILRRLAAEFGPKLRVFHYLPAVHPPGSDGHRALPPDAPRSLVNYYNFALSRTRYTHATKLDDDHVAMSEPMARLAVDVRSGRAAVNEIACFSGLNLARDAAGRIGVLGREPSAGSGDHWIFPVRPETYFVHDRRFEVLQHRGLRRRFHSIAYWHLKHLKPGFGFSNYDLPDNPRSRYAKRLKALEADHSVIELAELARQAAQSPRLLDRMVELGLPVPERDRIIAARRHALARHYSGVSLERAMALDLELGPFIGTAPAPLPAAEPLSTPAAVEFASARSTSRSRDAVSVNAR